MSVAQRLEFVIACLWFAYACTKEAISCLPVSIPSPTVSVPMKKWIFGLFLISLNFLATSS